MADSPSVVVLGWDDWQSTNGQAASFQNKATGSASSETPNVIVQAQTGSADSTWGSSGSQYTLPTGSSFIRQKNNDSYFIDFDITAESTRTLLRSFHFDAKANNANANLNWTLSVESGDVTLGTVARGSIEGQNGWEDVDVSLNVLADADLGSGGSATFRLTWWGGTPSSVSLDYTGVDNVAIRASIPDVEEATVLGLGERAEWLRGTWGAFWGPAAFYNGSGDDLSIKPFLEQVSHIKTLDFIQLRLGESYISSSSHNGPHSILESLWQGDVDEDGDPINLTVPLASLNHDPFLENITAIKEAGLKVQVYVNSSQLLERWRSNTAGNSWRLDPQAGLEDITTRWKEYCDTKPMVQAFINSKNYHLAEEDAYPERKYMFCYAEFILREYAIRYGELIDAWIFDSGNMMSDYNGDSITAGTVDEQRIYEAFSLAARAGNTDVAISFNNGQESTENPFAQPTRFCDYMFGHPFNSGKLIGSKEVETDSEGSTYTRYDRNYSFISWMKETNGRVHENGGWGDDGYEEGDEWTWDDDIVGHIYFPMSAQRWNYGSELALSDEDFIKWTEDTVIPGGAVTWGIPLVDANIPSGYNYTAEEWAMPQLEALDAALSVSQNPTLVNWARARTFFPTAYTGRTYYRELVNGVDFWHPSGVAVDRLFVHPSDVAPSWLNIEQSGSDPDVWIFSGVVPSSSEEETYAFRLRAGADNIRTNRAVEIVIEANPLEFDESSNGSAVWISDKIYLDDAYIGEDNVYELVSGREFYDFEGDEVVVSKKWGPSWVTIEQSSAGIWTLACDPQAADLGSHRLRLRLDDGSNTSLATMLITVVAKDLIEVKAEANISYGVNEVVSMESDWFQAFDGEAIYRVAFDVTPQKGDAIVSGISFDNVTADTNWGIGSDATIGNTDEIYIDNVRLINFRTRDGDLTADHVKSVNLKSIRLINPNAIENYTESILGMKVNGQKFQLPHHANSSRELDLPSIFDADSVDHLSVYMDTVQNEEVESKWSIESLELEVLFE